MIIWIAVCTACSYEQETYQPQYTGVQYCANCGEEDTLEEIED